MKKSLQLKLFLLSDEMKGTVLIDVSGFYKLHRTVLMGATTFNIMTLGIMAFHNDIQHNEALQKGTPQSA
jgi:hypothetical protein